MDKQELVKTIINIFGKKIIGLEKAILETQNSANNETKSSMGDKYETGRAMAQNEIAILQNQLAATRTDFDTFKRINYELGSPEIVLGSLVNTNMGWLLISVGLGKIVHNKIPVFCISRSSPLGQTLFSKKKGDSFLANKKTYSIIDIL